MPGFGPNGFGEGKPYTRPEHLYLKQVANIAVGEKEGGSDAVPDANAEDLRIFEAAPAPAEERARRRQVARERGRRGLAQGGVRPGLS